MDPNSAKRSNGSSRNLNSLVGRRTAITALVLLAAALRFAHFDLLWIEEAYPMAAAAEILRGKMLYRDIWFDKPPLYALIYTLWHAVPGWPLRAAGAVFVCGSCYLAWRFVRELAGEDAGLLAASLLALHLTFDIPSAVMALAPDLLTLPLHLAAVYFAWRGRGFASGLCAGVALLFNSKALFIAVACLLWTPGLPFLAGFAAPNVLAGGWLLANGALGAYWREVWVWGSRYSADTFLTNPVREGVLRTANWLGFHAALVAGLWVAARKHTSWRMLLWLAISFAAVCAGLRFFPRYYFHLLPVFVVLGAQGLMSMRLQCRALILLTVLIPVVRFGPRYISVVRGARDWSDLRLMKDSEDAAALVRSVARPGDRLLVWGYRPDIFVFSGVPAATPFLDSQPVNGVLADRHLVSSKATAVDLATGNLQIVERAKPEIIVDGLGPINPGLAVGHYPELHIAGYKVAGRTESSVVYVVRR
jgi:hypothetical protein